MPCIQSEERGNDDGTSIPLKSGAADMYTASVVTLSLPALLSIAGVPLYFQGFTTTKKSFSLYF